MALVLVSSAAGDVWMDEDTGSSVPATAEQARAVSAGSTLEDWFAITKGVLSAVQIAQLNQINVDRAKSGLQPLDVTRYTGVGVQVGLNPQTQQLLMYGGLALLAVLLIGSLSKR